MLIYNTITDQFFSRLPTQWQTPQGMVVLRSMDQARQYGFVSCEAFDVPAGQVKISGTQRAETIDGVVHEMWDTESEQDVADRQAQEQQAILDGAVSQLLQVPPAVSAVTILAQMLSLYGLTIPCGGYQGALSAIGQMTLTDVQTQMIGSLDTLYRAALSICESDAIITAMWESISEV